MRSVSSTIRRSSSTSVRSLCLSIGHLLPIGYGEELPVGRARQTRCSRSVLELTPDGAGREAGVVKVHVVVARIRDEIGEQGVVGHVGATLTFLSASSVSLSGSLGTAASSKKVTTIGPFAPATTLVDVAAIRACRRHRT